MFVDGIIIALKVLTRYAVKFAHVAQEVEHILGKDEVTGSSPVVGSRIRHSLLVARCSKRRKRKIPSPLWGEG